MPLSALSAYRSLSAAVTVTGPALTEQASTRLVRDTAFLSSASHFSSGEDQPQVKKPVSDSAACLRAACFGLPCTLSLLST